MAVVQYLERWLAPPLFAGEEEKTRQAHLINLLIRAGLILISIIFVLLPLVTTSINQTRFLAAVVALLICLVLAKFSLNAGWVHETGHLISVVLWITLAITTVAGPEGLTGTPFISVVTLTPLVAGFVSGTRVSIVITGLNWALGSMLVWLESSGRLAGNSGYEPLAQFLALMVMFSALPLLVYLWRRSFNEAIEQVQVVNQAQRETAAYRLQNEALEEAVLARTSELEESLAREQQLAGKLAQALALETELGELQSRIITVVTHEFRTPLSIINSSSELLQQFYERLSPERRDAAHGRIREAVFYLNDLLKDVTLVEQTQRERIRPSYQTFPFSLLSQQLSERILRDVTRPHRVTFQYAAKLQTPVHTDLDLLQQIGANLVSNALKYSDDKTQVQVRFWHDEHQFVLEVQDEGIGIPPQEQARVFELFYRASNVDERRGLGLGLFIVQAISRMMQGQVNVVSQGANQGTTFQVYLPLASAGEQALI
ncbi:MAG: HAMP domain-containing histidine kinase [Anaerolineaceae bacterium]|nr:HAMP domain-containing histidine kinase [Anaerolineaceae bacterium]